MARSAVDDARLLPLQKNATSRLYEERPLCSGFIPDQDSGSVLEPKTPYHRA